MNKKIEKTKTGYDYYSRDSYLISRFVANMVIALYPVIKDYEKLPQIKVGGHFDPSLGLHVTVFLAAYQKLQEIAFTEAMDFEEEHEYWYGSSEEGSEEK